MDAIVLAGGFATRLWPITRNRPKMLLPVGDTTVIDTLLEDFEDDDRVEDVYVSTNEAFADTFAEHLEESSFEKPILSIEDTSEEDEKFGVVGALAQLVDRESLDDDLLVVAGDNLVGFDLSEFVDFFEQEGTPSIAAYDVGSREKAKSYGLVELDGKQVVDFQEKPDNPKSTLVSIACYAFPKDVVSEFETYLADDGNPDEPGWFIQWLQSQQTVNAFSFDEAWFDIGSAEGYLDAVAWTLGGENQIAESAVIEDSELDDVCVMPGAEVRDSVLERAVIFPESTVENAVLTRTVVDREASVLGTILADSTVGAHCDIEASPVGQREFEERVIQIEERPLQSD
ncbi:sugar phosphate nucleotidyltransferase [Halomarina rubra]|uniref:Sugar phosphate nucleotidyltransferase n=1 Tax=Halomarina rubra TaxID=2071873 RepID=A0ABD6AX53_9EURY|nr:sugar phosphate nucleotidyltransferase [Halomarina rubra]